MFIVNDNMVTNQVFGGNIVYNTLWDRITGIDVGRYQLLGCG